MTITEELERFHEYAVAQLTRVKEEVTLEELLIRWRADRDSEETHAGIQRGLADLEAGRYRDADEFLTEFRQSRSE